MTANVTVDKQHWHDTNVINKIDWKPVKSMRTQNSMTQNSLKNLPLITPKDKAIYLPNMIPQIQVSPSYGPFEHEKKRHTYEGQFYQGQPHGWGIMHYDDYSYYQGEWNQGVPHGFGRFLG